MVESFFTALNVVLPICFMMLCGTLLKHGGIIKQEFVTPANKLIFRLLLPASLFRSCYSGNLQSAGNLRMIIFCCSCVLAVFLLYIPIAKAISSNNSEQSVIVQAAFRGNLAMFGLPVLTLLYNGEHLGIMAILLAFIIPELNILAVICFEVFGGQKKSLKHVFLHICQNPLILAIILGILCNITKIRIPAFLDKALEQLAGATTPLAFVLLGISFSFKAARSNRKLLSVAIIGKLIILPFFAFACGIMLGIRGPALASVITLFGSPTAVSSVPMAEELGGDTRLASEAVVISTMLGVFTMFGWLFLLSYFHLL